MIEKYIALRYFMEFKLPLIIICVIGVVVVIAWLIGLIIKSWERRQKRYIDKYFGEDK